MTDQRFLNGAGQPQISNGDRASALAVSKRYPEVHQPTAGEQQNGSLLIEYWQLFRNYKGTLVLAACFGILAGVLLTLPQTPVYEASTTVEFQNLNENFLNMGAVNATQNVGGPDPLQTDLQTQISIIQSKSVLGQVIADLDLAAKLKAASENTRLFAFRKALGIPDPKPALREDVLREVARNLKVSALANTRLIEISYDSTDPNLAANVANSLTVAYSRQNLESHWKTTQETGEWLTHEMEDVRIKLEKSEQQLQSYATNAGLLFTSEKDNIAEAKLRQLQEELSRAEGDRVTKQSQYERLAAASADSLPEVLDDSTLKDYQVKLTDLRRQLAELSSTLTPLNPAVKKVQAEVTSLEAARDTARANVTHRIQNEFESAERRERLLTIDYNDQAHVVTEQAAKATHYNTLKREVDNNRQLYDSMLQHVREAGIASALHTSNVRVVDPARAPERPYKPSTLLNATLGLFAGSFLGIVFIVVRERADRSIQTPGEASLYLDVPELGVIPSAGSAHGPLRFRLRFRVGNVSDVQTRKTLAPSPSRPVELVTWKDRPSLMADSFRSTMASILYIGENGDRPRVIAITSASPGEGKTTVATNLALALAEIGQRVLLIDGDLRRPRLHEIFKVSNDRGVSDVLCGSTPSKELAIRTNYGGLHVLPSGSAPASISNLLHSPEAFDYLQRMREEFDTVLIDTPPMLPMPDARVVGRLVDGVILVVRASRTTKDAAAAASQRLVDDGTRLLGTVLNEWDPRKTGRAGYEYSSYHYRGSRPSSAR